MNIDELYLEYQTKYFEWANKERPNKGYAEPKPESLMGNPDDLEKYGTFRRDEWKAYVIARDRYLKAVNTGCN